MLRKTIVALTMMLVMLASTVFASAAPDPYVVIVNPVPNSTIYNNDLLISVKVLQPKNISIKVYEERLIANGTTTAISVSTQASLAAINSEDIRHTLIGEAQTFTSSNNLSFYTKRVNVTRPGLYMVQVDTLDKDGKVIYTKSSYVSVKEKEAVTEETKIFTTQQSGTMQILSNLLKTLFGN